MATAPTTTVPSQQAVSKPVTPAQPVASTAAPSFANDALTPQANKSGMTPAQMSATASAQSAPVPPPAVSPPAPSNQSIIQASQAAPGTLQSGSNTGTTNAAPGSLPAVPTTFQAYTAPTNANGQALNPGELATTAAFNQQQADLLARQKQALAVANQSPVSSYFNATTGQWQSTPVMATTGLVTSALTQALQSATTSSGVMTTDGIDAVSAATKTALDQATSTQLSGMTLPTSAAQDPLVASLTAQATQIQSWINDPTTDPQMKAILVQQQMIDSEKTSDISDIATKADKSYNDQVAANAEVTGQMRVAMATGGVTGSPLGLTILAGVQKSNTRSLQDIRDSETDAIRQATESYNQQDYQNTLQQLQLADSRRQQYNDLQTQAHTVNQQMQEQALQIQQAQQQAVLTHQQIVANGKQAASDTLSVFAKQGLDVSAVPQAVWDQAVQDSGGTITTATAKAMYAGSLIDQQAKTSSAFNANIDAFYQAAQALPANSNQTLYRPNPDGTFTSISRSSVQTNPQYDTFQSTKNGKNYVEYVDKNDPSQRKEVELGIVDPKTTYKDDAFGNTEAIIDNGDGTFSSKKVLDFMGNPLGSVAVTNTQEQLDSSGHSYSQNSGAPSWTPDNGSIHTRDGKPATECGQYVNDMLGTHFPDSLDGKIKQCDPTIGTANNPVQPGDAVVTNEAPGTGHVAIVASVGADDKGKYYILNESNYKKNSQGQGMVETGRKVYANSPSIQGFGRGSVDPAQENQNIPQAPQDNKMSWTVNAPAGSAISTAVQNGTVQDVTQVGSYQDGSPMYMATIKDNQTGTITNYSGIKQTDLRVGSSWSPSEKSPSIGTTGDGGHTVDLRNTDGSPVAPTGNTLSRQIAAGQSWGQYDFIPATPAVQTRYNTILGQVSKGTISLDSALQRMKSDPVLGQITPQTYLADFQDASDQGQMAKTQKETTIAREQQTIKTQQAMTAQRILNLVPDFQQQKTTGVIAKAVVAENVQRDISSALNNGDDAMLVDAISRYQNAGGAVTEGQLQLLKSLQTPWDKLQVMKGQAAGKRSFLSDDQKQALVNATNESIGTTMQQYQQYTAGLQDILKQNGSDMTIPSSPLGLNVALDQANQQQIPDLSSMSSIDDPQLGNITFTD